MKQATLLISFICLLVVVCYALPDFVGRFPNGDAGMREGSGITCDHLGHVNCIPGAQRNGFGQDFDDNGRRWDKELCEKDSDGDGLTNGEELGDPCCEWSADNPTRLRQDQLSHPGDPDQTANIEPGCRQANGGSTSPPTSTDGDGDQANGGSTPPPTSTDGDGDQANGGSTPPPTSTDDDGVCFPAHATVQLESGLRKRMDQLEIGDRVHVGGGRYSAVFLFTHKVPDVTHEFVTIRAGTEKKVEASITLTKGHFVYANRKMVTADQVKIGDMLELHDGRMTPVVEVECATFKGLYNPQTTNGLIVVDGVKVSTYTTAVQSGIAHSLLAPLRAVYRWFGWTMKSLESGAPRLAKILP